MQWKWNVKNMEPIANDRTEPTNQQTNKQRTTHSVWTVPNNTLQHTTPVIESKRCTRTRTHIYVYIYITVVLIGCDSTMQCNAMQLRVGGRIVESRQP
mmetsp:Transcript_15376/g.33158  ORF Transcript_15376/g.33158 Transcript_15376/m.33158 type:complete len:98 (-) Transcript_15376:172-465(-)